MAVSPTLAEGLAAATVEHYAAAERSLLELLARYMARGITAPGWAQDKLAQVQLFRRQAEGVVARLDREVSGSVAVAVAAGWNRGTAAGVADIADTGDPIVSALPGRAALELLIGETLDRVRAPHTRIVRLLADVYQRVVSRATSPLLAGAVTRREAAQRALDEFAAEGVSGFVDRSGRRWHLASYAEMAVRTAAGRAAVDAHSNRLLAAGRDLVIVSDAPQECVLCRPWEGKVLSLTGADPAGGVLVAGTLTAARAAGLYHPGCRHSHGLYVPGATRRPVSTADPAGDAARQHLRYLERQVRAWKRREAVALDVRHAAVARARVRGYQAQIRDHVAATTAKRQPQRERIGRAR